MKNSQIKLLWLHFQSNEGSMKKEKKKPDFYLTVNYFLFILFFDCKIITFITKNDVFQSWPTIGVSAFFPELFKLKINWRLICIWLSLHGINYGRSKILSGRFGIYVWYFVKCTFDDRHFFQKHRQKDNRNIQVDSWLINTSYTLSCFSIPEIFFF